LNNRLKSFLKELKYIKDFIPSDTFTDLARKATALAEKDDRLLTPSEVAKRLGVSGVTIWRWLKKTFDVLSTPQWTDPDQGI